MDLDWPQARYGKGDERMRKNITTNLTLFTILLFVNTSEGAGQMLSVVKDGKANAVIVLREEPNGVQIKAAKVLADHLKQISGADIEIIGFEDLEGPTIKNDVIVPEDGVTKVETFIFIGDGDLARFNLKVDTSQVGYGGFIVKTFPNSIVFSGRDNNDPGELSTSDNRNTPYSRGTLYAVTWFLEKYLGVRYLWPGETGKIVPRKSSISIPEINYKITPKLKQRQIRICLLGDRGQAGLDWLHIPKHDYLKMKSYAKKTVSESVNWRAWHRLGGTLGVISGDGYILPEELWKQWPAEHPEWFAMQQDGDRSQIIKGKLAERPRLCVSNIDLIDAIAVIKIAELKAHPEQRCVSIELHDGGYAGFCMCDKCKTLDAQNARKVKIWSWSHKDEKMTYFDYPSMTDRNVYFWNEVAKRVTKEFPDVLLLVKQYGVYSSPPIKNTLHPNIIVRFVGEWYFRDVGDGSRRMMMDDWKAWSKMASNIFFRPNLLYLGYHQGFPLVNYVHKFAEDFRYMADHAMLGTDFDAIIEMWSTQGLVYYVVTKLNWNPYLNVDDIIDDYCQAGFGNGWKNIRRYWDRIEALTDQVSASTDMHLLDPFTPEVIEELTQHLEHAVRDADGNQDVLARIAFLRSGLTFTDMQAKAFRLNNKIKDDRKNKRLQVQGQAMLDQKWIFMRDLFAQYPLSIDMGSARFYSQRCFYYLTSRNLPSSKVIKKEGAWKYKQQGGDTKILEADRKGRLVEQ